MLNQRPEGSVPELHSLSAKCLGRFRCSDRTIFYFTSYGNADYSHQSGFMLLFRVSFPWVLLNCTALKSLDNGQFSTVHQKHTIQKRIEGSGSVAVAVFTRSNPAEGSFWHGTQVFYETSQWHGSKQSQLHMEFVLSRNLRRRM